MYPSVDQSEVMPLLKRGVLIYNRRDLDPFQEVKEKEWWNSNGLHYRAPAEHLFEQMGNIAG